MTALFLIAISAAYMLGRRHERRLQRRIQRGAP